MRRFVGFFLLALIIVVGAAGFWFYGRLRASLPQLDGQIRLSGLSAPVAVERDAQGVPTLKGATRADLARALGFLHGQDRFFQMDLMRRRAAGELAELFGRAALRIDEIDRRHGFRALSQQVLARASPEERALIGAYAAGVNAGLASLRAKPFEYYVLRTEPQVWKPEDSILVAYAMALTLQGGNGDYPRSLADLRDAWGNAAVAFFAPLLTPSDAALDGSTAPLPPVPGPEIINLRKQPAEPQPLSSALETTRSLFVNDLVSPGSNAFAVSGSLTRTGSAILANDMHLDLAVPNTWYRASMRMPGLRLDGVTLPGVPFLIAGSNGHIAWGFTNSFVDTADLILVTPTESPTFYLAPKEGGLKEYERREETIQVKGSKPVVVAYTWTMYGPIVGQTGGGRGLAYHWAAYDPDYLRFDMCDLEKAGSVDEAVAVAHRLDILTNNFVVADSSGRIAWTLIGRIPKRIGYDGRFPVSWDYGDRHWDGYLSPGEVPVVSGRSHRYLWSANSRPIGGKALQALGDGGYERPARAAQIRDDLARLRAPVAPADLLAIQLDDRADFLSRWRDLMAGVLARPEASAKPSRAALAAALSTWTGRADPGSAGYRLVRLFRQAVTQRVLDPIFAPCREADHQFDPYRFQSEEAVWTLLKEKPMHLLAPMYATWDDLLLASADDVSEVLRREHLAPAAATWGRHNTLAMRHPFGRVFPAWLTAWLDMPAEALPGDTDMPRVQAPEFGASERFVVSPGHEAQGIFEMPGGESGHPLSPFYRAGHEAWAQGEAAPFLPGPAEHRLELEP